MVKKLGVGVGVRVRVNGRGEGRDDGAGVGTGDGSRGGEKTKMKTRTLTAKQSQSALDRRAKRPRLAGSAADSRDELLVEATRPEESKTVADLNPPEADTKLNTLAALLDLRALTSHSDIQLRFGAIARALVHDYVLVVSIAPTAGAAGGNEAEEEAYDVLEVEFYFHTPTHADPFAHCAHEQRVSGNWYFHRMKTVDPATTSTPGYKGGTRKGLDLTFGGPVMGTSPYFASSAPSAATAAADNANATYGGILLRTLRRQRDNALFCGPSTLVDELLRAARAPSVAALITTHLCHDTRALRPRAPGGARLCSIALVPRPTPEGQRVPKPKPKPIVHHTPRVGLNLSHPSSLPSPACPRAIFVRRPYRFLASPALLSSGRAQTVIGLYTALSDAEILNEAGVREETVRLSGVSGPVVERYVGEYRRGFEAVAGKGLEGKKKELERYVGKRGKGVCAQPAAWCAMMGVLAALEGG